MSGLRQQHLLSPRPLNWVGTARTERCTPAGLKCPWSPAPLRLGYLQSHLSLTCSRATSTATVLEKGQQTSARGVGRQSSVGFSVCTFIYKEPRFPVGVYVLIGARLRCQADASGTDSPKFVTLSIPSGKRAQWVRVVRQMFSMSFFPYAAQHRYKRCDKSHKVHSIHCSALDSPSLSLPCFRAVLGLMS